MSSAPKSGGIPNAVVYALIAAAVVILLLCGGVGFFFLVKGSGSGDSVNKSGKAISPEDALKSSEDFLNDLKREEYGHALKYRATSGFRRKYNEESLKEFIESEGKGVIGALRLEFKLVDQTPEGVKFVGQAGNGPYGLARFEVSVSDEGQGPRVSKLTFIK
jgi:hypothetical protein